VTAAVRVVFPERGSPLLDQLEPLFAQHVEHLSTVGQVVPMVPDAPHLWRVAVERGIGRLGTVAVAVTRPDGAADEQAIGFCYGVIRALPDYLGGAKFATMPHFFVQHHHRGVGVGSQLFRAFEQWCIDRGCTSIESYVAMGDQRAMRFWEAAAFQHEHTQIRKPL
jgi:GNAT superfamily N-acetyltransferase